MFYNCFSVFLELYDLLSIYWDFLQCIRHVSTLKLRVYRKYSLHLPNLYLFLEHIRTLPLSNCPINLHRRKPDMMKPLKIFTIFYLFLEQSEILPLLNSIMINPH